MPLSAWLFTIGSAFLFGLALNFTRIAVGHISSSLGSMISIPTAAVLFWLSSPLTVDFSGWRNDAAVIFFLTGLFYPALITTITFEAARILGPNITATLGNLTPVWAVAAGLLLLDEALGTSQLAGIAIIVFGVTALTSSRGNARGTGFDWPMWALTLPITASLLRGLGQPALKFGFEIWNNPKVATLLCYAASAMVVIALGLVRKHRLSARFTAKGIAWFMLIGVLNGLATWAGIEAVSRGPVSIVVPVAATYPLFTLLIGLVMFRGTKISFTQVAGVVLVGCGVVIILVV